MNYQLSKIKYFFATVIILFTTVATIGYLYFVKEYDECNALSGTTGMQAPTENYWKCLDSKSCTLNTTGGGGDPTILDSNWVEYECVSKPQVSFIPKCSGFNESFTFLYSISSPAPSIVHIEQRQDSVLNPIIKIGEVFYSTPYHENEIKYILKSITENEAVFGYTAISNTKSLEGEAKECSGEIITKL